MKNGMYTEILETFKNLQERQHESTDHAESLKDACILVHGLSLSKVPFNFLDPRLKLILEYLISSSDSDIHYDVSTMLLNFTKQLACNLINSFHFCTNSQNLLYFYFFYYEFRKIQHRERSRTTRKIVQLWFDERDYVID